MSSVYSPGIAQGNIPGSQLTAGLGSFRGADFVLTAYGCFRSGAAVLCDFDVTKQDSAQIKAAMLWSALGLKDENGRLARRHDAFFVANDGNRSPLATLSANPVRLMMEFTDVDAQLSAVSLVNGQDQIPGVPIDMADPGQPEGAIPLRAASTQTATAVQAVVPTTTPAPPAAQRQPPAVTANVNPVDAANRAVDKANQTVNKAKAAKDTVKGIMNTLKGLQK